MLIAPIPYNEEQRLQVLANYHILDTGKEQAFEDIVLLASFICETPIALVSLVDRNRQWFKATKGLNAAETSRDIAFCSHAILQEGVFIISDATKDSRFADNPLVTGNPDIRFYAGAPLVTQDGFPLGTLCVIDTVPKQLRQEQADALKALSRQVIAQLELRLVVNKLTSTLNDLRAKEEALQLEKEKAESLAAARARFLSHMSHDIRTPLTAIIGFGRILKKQSERLKWEEDTKVLLKRINDGGAYLLELINHILELSRLESGKVRVENEDVCVNELFAYLQNILQSLIDEKQLNFVIAIEDSVPSHVYTDRIRLCQVILNLLGNAIKFSPEGGAITLSAWTAADKFFLSVKDNGIGIEAAKQKLIFDAFDQENREIAINYGGSGLGLAIVKQTLQVMGGDISLKSEAGKGAEFTIQLPMQR